MQKINLKEYYLLPHNAVLKKDDVYVKNGKEGVVSAGAGRSVRWLSKSLGNARFYRKKKMADEPTLGTKIAAKARKECNKHSKSKRKELVKKGVEKALEAAKGNLPKEEQFHPRVGQIVRDGSSYKGEVFRVASISKNYIFGKTAKNNLISTPASKVVRASELDVRNFLDSVEGKEKLKSAVGIVEVNGNGTFREDVQRMLNLLDEAKKITELGTREEVPFTDYLIEFVKEIKLRKWQIKKLHIELE